jgi:hypothetical protein
MQATSGNPTTVEIQQQQGRKTDRESNSRRYPRIFETPAAKGKAQTEETLAIARTPHCKPSLIYKFPQKL